MTLLFTDSKETRKFPAQNYGKLQEQLKAFNWTYVLDEDHFYKSGLEDDEEYYASKADYIATQKWHKRRH